MNADRMDQETAERLLGGTIEPSTGSRPVVLLLTAARAAPRPAELAGEDVAVLAFRRERHGRLHPDPERRAGEGVALGAPTVSRRPARHPRGLAGFGARAAVAALALIVSGGVALAAATGGPAPRPPQPPTATPPAPVGPPPVTDPVTGGEARSGAPATSGPAPSSSVAAEMAGLCRAYQAIAGNDHGRALDNPVFSGLIVAAGDRQRVPGYCERVLAAAPRGASDGRPGAAPSRRPQTPGSPKTRPTAAGPDHTAPHRGDGRQSPPVGPPT
ncbi:hypothetical protein [Micromonospora sp. CV4]|uniref:hypothetical protein n=1 Tax=Micromonospora sp. CV4 TaxID=2478711 RepID=UPI000EF4E713|nr:hypothetical protein [Micromonospora sp. CV4]RLP95557.1 hypothetical protein EAD98_13175 [Micromonospora sp. CV4]